MSPTEHLHNQGPSPSPDHPAMTIVHDNNPWSDSLKMAWGLSVLVTGTPRTILFDTGSDGTLLLENMAALNIDPASVDVVVLSHMHGDHAGGLTGFLRANPRVEVYLPRPMPARVREVVEGYGATITEVAGPQEIAPGVYTTGVMGRRIHEQALIVSTCRGLIVLTGCAHPGIARIVEKAVELQGEPVLLVIGGFHLEWATAGQVEQIIAGFSRHDIRYVAPTHCAGEKARHLLQQRYGPGYIEAGVGRTLSLADLM